MKRVLVSWALVVATAIPAFGQVSQTGSEGENLAERVRVLEAQIVELQARVDALLQARPVSTPPIAELFAPEGEVVLSPGSVIAALGPIEPTDAPARQGQATERSSTALNPAIGMIGNFISTTGQSRGGSDNLAPLPFLTLQESEASLSAVVDPYAQADFFLALGEEGIEVEEGYVTFTALPGGLLAKVGKMRANFGRLNAFHNHTLPWIDRPLVMFNLLGGSADDPDTGIKDAGISVSRLIPAGKVFLEATGELFRGDSGPLFTTTRRRDFSTVARLRSYIDLTEETNLEAGASYSRGHNDVGSGFITQLYGADATVRWKPLRRAIYNSFVARTELIWSRREEGAGTQRAFGFYASADYQLARRWFAGARYDQAQRGRLADVRDRGLSAVLTFWPSGFSQVRGQYRLTRFEDTRRTAHELMFQLLFTIGAHGAHPF